MLASLHPRAQPAVHRVERINDLRYGPDSMHTLDIWRPVEPGPHPCVLYVHGGGFRILSKNTHWIMALALSRRGYVVCNINYRLAPVHRFPAALHDSCRAWLWMLDHIEAFGGDPTTSVIAGESAGANLAAGVTLASCERFDGALWTEEVFARGKVPDAVLASCGMFQVSSPEHLWQHKPHFPSWLQDRVIEVSDGYIPTSADVDTSLMDPLLWLEARKDALTRALPPFFLPIGTRDPLLPDTRRMQQALQKLGAKSVATYYPGEVHAFHAFVWRQQARQCWTDTHNFLARHAPGSRMNALKEAETTRGGS